MKRTGIVCLALICALLTGCGAAAGSTVDRADPPAPNGAQVSSQSREAVTGVLTAEQTENAPAPLKEEEKMTEDEVLSAYERAITAWTWLERDTLPAGGEPVILEGSAYQKVNAEGFYTLEDLRTYLRGLFSEELVAQLLPETGGLYCDVDGALYVKPVSRGEDPYKGAVSAAVEQVQPTTYLVNVTVELLDQDMVTINGLECYSFPYELVGDRWVFTAFALVN